MTGQEKIRSVLESNNETISHITSFLRDNVTATLSNVHEFVDTINNSNIARISQDMFDLIHRINKHFIGVQDNKMFVKNIPHDKILFDSGFDYTQDQREAIKGVCDFLTDVNKRYLRLSGYAGTGKTTLVTNLVSSLITKNYAYRIALTATTNKATNVIKEKLDSHLRNTKQNIDKGEVIFTTMQKLFGFKMTYDRDTGKKVFRGGKSLSLNHDLIIIDECSMIGLTALSDIFTTASGNDYIKIIFVGDSAQLPPVGESSSSIFDTQISGDVNCDKYVNENLVNLCLSEVHGVNLKEIVRTGDKGIVDTCLYFRNRVEEKPTKYRNVDELALNVLKNSRGANFFRQPSCTTGGASNWHRKFISDIQRDVDAITIVWRNKTVDDYCGSARLYLFGENVERFEKGEILLMNEHYDLSVINPGLNKKFFTSEKIRIQKLKRTEGLITDFTPKDVPFYVNMFSSGGKRVGERESAALSEISAWYDRIKQDISDVQIDIWKMFVVCKDSDSIWPIVVLGDTNPAFFEAKRKNADRTKEVIKRIDKFYGGRKAPNIIVNALWRHHERVFVDPYASVSYGYAITTHKAQGSTYDNVYVDLGDIAQNRTEKEMYRCSYTAASRAARKLNIQHM